MGRAVGHPGARVRGYIALNQLAASRSRPRSRGSTRCRGVPAPPAVCTGVSAGAPHHPFPHDAYRHPEFDHSMRVASPNLTVHVTTTGNERSPYCANLFWKLHRSHEAGGALPHARMLRAAARTRGRVHTWGKERPALVPAQEGVPGGGGQRVNVQARPAARRAHHKPPARHGTSDRVKFGTYEVLNHIRTLTGCALREHMLRKVTALSTAAGGVYETLPRVCIVTPGAALQHCPPVHKQRFYLPPRCNRPGVAESPVVSCPLEHPASTLPKALRRTCRAGGAGPPRGA